MIEIRAIRMHSILGLAILILVLAAIIWIARRSSRITKRDGRLFYTVVGKDQARVDPYPYLYVNADGSARELHPNERNLLETPFYPADGARPYVKSNYLQKNGWGEIAGFLERSKLPRGTQILAAPEEVPFTPLTKEDHIRFLRDKGMEVIENSDGSITARRPDC
jgi:hypothetical protein